MKAMKTNFGKTLSKSAESKVKKGGPGVRARKPAEVEITPAKKPPRATLTGSSLPMVGAPPMPGAMKISPTDENEPVAYDGKMSPPPAPMGPRVPASELGMMGKEEAQEMMAPRVSQKKRPLKKKPTF